MIEADTAFELIDRYFDGDMGAAMRWVEDVRHLKGYAFNQRMAAFDLYGLKFPEPHQLPSYRLVAEWCVDNGRDVEGLPSGPTA